MHSFRTRYCAAQRCRRDQFVQHVFWQCLHRHAVLFAPFVLLMRGDCFRADQELIDLAGRVFTLRDLNEELRNFARAHRQRKGGWRERVLVGLSTERLRQLGRRYLPVGSAGWIEAEG